MNSIPSLSRACNDVGLLIVTPLLKVISKNNLNLNDTEKTELLPGEYESAVSALYRACYIGRHEVVTRLIAMMCNVDPNLDMATREELIIVRSLTLPSFASCSD